jgi:glycosyltransferase involved in cell wall biosynthesis
MQAGTPVVTYGGGAVPEVVGDCAVIVPPGDRAALTEAIARLLADPAERERLATCGRDRATQFSVDAMVAGFRARYAAIGMQRRA